MKVTSQLVKPFSYLFIKHESKYKVDWAVPLALTVVTLIFYFIVNSQTKIDVFSPNGFTSKILGFVQSLPGFYIAALAAIATFNKKDIDYLMPNPAPKIEMTIAGARQKIELTRRRFLCLMFAFLTAESILLIGISIMALAIAEPLKSITPESHRDKLLYTFVGIYLFLFWQMIVATFWGLYYLGDKLHHADTSPPSLPT